MSKRKSMKGFIIKGVLENQPKEFLELALDELKDIIKEDPGIYALYKGKKLYRVGLAKRTIRRLPAYLKSKTHRDKWDNFSVYVVKREKHLKDLETLVLRTARPEGNKILGNIPRHHDMQRKLNDVLRKYRRIAQVYSRKM